MSKIIDESIGSRLSVLDLSKLEDGEYEIIMIDEDDSEMNEKFIVKDSKIIISDIMRESIDDEDMNDELILDLMISNWEEYVKSIKVIKN